MSEADRRSIAEVLLGELLGQRIALETGGFCACPGVGMHTKGNGKRDFRVVLDGAPTGYCFHGSCSAVVEGFNKELRRRIWFSENGREARAPRHHWGAEVAAEPKAEARPNRPPLDHAQIEEFTRGCPEIAEAWVARRSAVEIAGLSSLDFLAALYREDERVLVFTDQRSQGDFIVWKKPAELGAAVVATGYRLSQQRGVKAVESRLPAGAPEGVWFLTQPVSGQWIVRSDASYPPEGGREVSAKYTRRSQGNVAAWRYFVLESDELPAEVWLRVLAHLALPIAAIYTSGKRSIHALVRYEVASKAEWDAVKKTLLQIVAPLGADPAALTAVRLSRLPGCTRAGQMQRLLYLCPNPQPTALRMLPELRP